jgi:hypothetical protein
VVIYSTPRTDTCQTAFVSLTSARAKVSQEHLDAVVNHYGPRLAAGLMQNIAGGATRGDLDWFVEPLKKFIPRTVHSKRLLEEALTSLHLGPTVSSDVRARFLKQISM